ncbi:MAG: hypothetical protein JHD16_18820, partial [Solirubrobacteraceae bacterium]|nr:hypothetical protein [Solirubrobacteraceae bacterium]
EDAQGKTISAPLMVHEVASAGPVKWALLAGALLFGGLGLLQILRGTVWRGVRES